MGERETGWVEAHLKVLIVVLLQLIAEIVEVVISRRQGRPPFLQPHSFSKPSIPQQFLPRKSIPPYPSSSSPSSSGSVTATNARPPPPPPPTSTIIIVVVIILVILLVLVIVTPISEDRLPHFPPGSIVAIVVQTCVAEVVEDLVRFITSPVALGFEIIEQDVTVPARGGGGGEVGRMDMVVLGLSFDALIR